MLYFIVNPNSRSGSGKKIWNLLHKELVQRKIAFQYKMTEYIGHATEHAAYFSSLGTPQDPVVIVVVGGDGTISEVLTGIVNLDNVIFGVIPTGSGNDFCRGMKLPTDPIEALDVILSCKRIMKLDIPRLEAQNHNGRFGISAGIGFDAACCHEIAVAPSKTFFNKIKLGKLVYVYTAIKQILFIKPSEMKITLDGDRRFRFSRVYFAAVMNQKYEGGGFQFCPKAKPNDQILDLIVVEGLSKLAILLCLPTAFWGKHTHFRGIHIMRCRSVQIQSAVKAPVHKDGEICGMQEKISVILEKSSLKIIVPVL
ncbi:MAG: YegS/Rv2252/BmrU family lipid kinase [Eubacteriales bacterium]|nr:YegS/Rv2252/BmrU family lipid kinase [Eubacteriales bacterium]